MGECPRATSRIRVLFSFSTRKILGRNGVMTSIVKILVVAVALFSVSEALQVTSAFARSGFRPMRTYFRAPVHRPSFHHVYRPAHVAPAIHRPSHPSALEPRTVVAPKRSTQLVQRKTHSSTPGHRPTWASQTPAARKRSASTSVPSLTAATTASTPSGASVTPVRGDLADWKLVKPDPFPGTPTDPQEPDNIRFGR